MIMNAIYRARKSQRSGFSLVEMLVVIAVIGVLTGSAIVAYGKIRDRAQAEVNLRNAKAVSLVAMAIYSSGGSELDTVTTKKEVVDMVLGGVQILNVNGITSFASTGIDPQEEPRISALLDWDPARRILTIKAN
jgi:type IV pilus assembly protein PilA